MITLCLERSTCRPFWISGGWLGRQSVRRSSTLSKTLRAATAPAVALWHDCHGTVPSSPTCLLPLKSTAWTWAWAALPLLRHPASLHWGLILAEPGSPSRKMRMMFFELPVPPASKPKKRCLTDASSGQCLWWLMSRRHLTVTMSAVDYLSALI